MGGHSAAISGCVGRIDAKKRGWDDAVPPVRSAEGTLLQFNLLQLPDLTESFVTVAWIAVGAVALLVVWEVATFAAYVIGVGNRDRH
jgi:hypothetical protein